MVVASISAASTRMAAVTGRPAQAPRVNAFTGFAAPSKMNMVQKPSKTFSASVAAHVSSVKVRSWCVLSDRLGDVTC